MQPPIEQRVSAINKSRFKIEFKIYIYRAVCIYDNLSEILSVNHLELKKIVNDNLLLMGLNHRGIYCDDNYKDTST